MRAGSGAAPVRESIEAPEAPEAPRARPSELPNKTYNKQKRKHKMGHKQKRRHKIGAVYQTALGQRAPRTGLSIAP